MENKNILRRVMFLYLCVPGRVNFVFPVSEGLEFKVQHRSTCMEMMLHVWMVIQCIVPRIVIASAKNL